MQRAKDNKFKKQPFVKTPVAAPTLTTEEIALAEKLVAVKLAEETALATATKAAADAKAAQEAADAKAAQDAADAKAAQEAADAKAAQDAADVSGKAALDLGVAPPAMILSPKGLQAANHTVEPLVLADPDAAVTINKPTSPSLTKS